ncbi:MAG: hypothetical protein LAO22_10825 [Acidobacteriia bacterium]|nr:hypothetical protein [Terriglobia bacterium]
MKLTIDNLDGRGPQDYTAFLDAGKSPHLTRKLNSPATLQFSLVTGDGDFVVPVVGARVMLGRSNGSDVFTGYVLSAPTYQYMGWAEKGPIYRYEVEARGDETVLDRKTPPPHPPFVARSAGEALRQLSEFALAGWFDYSGVEEGDPIPYYRVNPAQGWSASAAEIALAARCAYRDDGGKLYFAPLGEKTYELAETAADFSPGDLTLRSVDRIVNDLTILGPLEPSAHVRDYFVGDGFTTRFYLSQIPFTRTMASSALSSGTVLYEEYATLDPTHWTAVDPQHAIAVSGGQLRVTGGTGTDGQTCLDFVEQIELGGATVLNHGDVVFSAASDGVIGGLYAGGVSIAGCLAGFRISPSGTNCSIRALISGNSTGTALTTQAGHHYVFTTQLYPTEVYRTQQVFHSALHPVGASRGGNAIVSGVRVVLEVHDIDPANPATQVAPATVLYDNVLANAPGFCTYALVNAARMQCSVTFTYLFLAVDALVRSTLPQQSTRTRRTGSLREGAECHVSEEPSLQFYPQYIPAANEMIEVSYRGRNHARARVMNSAGIAALQRGGDDGVRGAVRQIAMPLPRTSTDCETAALALLDDAGLGWAGQYRTWSPFLPGGAVDIFPGDGLAVEVPSRASSFAAIVRDVDVEIMDVAGENCRYTLQFVDAADPSLDFAFQTATATQATAMAATEISAVGMFLADLTLAAVTNVSSTTVTVDTGFTPGAGEGIEVRSSDAGWGPDNDRNLAGRFTSSSFTLPRFGRVQDYFLRRYDNSSPPKYSRYSAGLHVDYPL